MMQEIPAHLNDVRLLLVQVRQPELQAGSGPRCIPELPATTTKTSHRSWSLTLTT